MILIIIIAIVVAISVIGYFTFGEEGQKDSQE